MDEPNRLKISMRLSARLALAGCLFALFAALAACTSSETKLPPPPPITSFPELVKSVVQWRGLPLKQQIILASAENAAKTAGPAPLNSYKAPPVAEMDRAYKALGLLPGNSDFGKALAEFHRLEQLINYDSAKSTVSWAADAARLGARLANVDAAKSRELPAVFAIVRALQEQHFKWRSTLDDVFLDDRRLAFGAVATGDAMLTWLTRGKSKDVDDIGKLAPVSREISAQVAAEAEKLAATLPGFLRRQWSFPYRQGSEFVSWALGAQGWRGVNGLYAKPPFATADILHPERYFIDPERPLRFFPAKLLRRFNESPAVEQTIGEDSILGLLAGESSGTSARETAAGWRGDQLFVFSGNANLTTVWFSSWKTEKHAQDFLRAYQAVLQTRQRVRFSPATDPINPPLIASARDQRGWLLQRSGSVVLLVSGSPASRLIELAADAWKDLAVEEETMELRFESAQIAAQFSLRSR